MLKPLPSKFKLTKGNFENSEEKWQVFEDAFKDDEIWKIAFKNCKKEDIHTLNVFKFPRRWTLPNIKLYTITEESTGYD